MRGAGRTPTIAVFAMFISSPCAMLTLTRTSCLALPRGDTHTVIGNPVSRGVEVRHLEQVVGVLLSPRNSGLGDLLDFHSAAPSACRERQCRRRFPSPSPR